MIANKSRLDVCYVNYSTISTSSNREEIDGKPIKTWENSIRALGKFVKGSSGNIFMKKKESQFVSPVK